MHADDITHEADDYAERSGLIVLPNTLVLHGQYNRRHWRAYPVAHRVHPRISQEF